MADQVEEPRKKLSELTEMQRTEICVVAWDHPYTCKCEICLAAWTMMGPDGGEKGNYGPFAAAEVQKFAEQEGMPFIEGE